MGTGICKFIPTKNANIRTVNFVYEVNLKKALRTPFFNTMFFMHVVTQGTATLKFSWESYELKKGTVFFTFPAVFYEIDSSDDFESMYISFTGNGILDVLTPMGITLECPVFYNHMELVDFWENSIERTTSTNMSVMADGVLLYSIAIVSEDNNVSTVKTESLNALDRMIAFIDDHYKDVDMSLKKVADALSYTEKYLSLIFKKHTSISFRTYLNTLRIQYATELIENGEISISKIAFECGYSDTLYFSKIFKKIYGITPTEYIKKRSAKRVK